MMITISMSFVTTGTTVVFLLTAMMAAVAAVEPVHFPTVQNPSGNRFFQCRVPQRFTFANPPARFTGYTLTAPIRLFVGSDDPGVTGDQASFYYLCSNQNLHSLVFRPNTDGSHASAVDITTHYGFGPVITGIPGADNGLAPLARPSSIATDSTPYPVLGNGVLYTDRNERIVHPGGAISGRRPLRDGAFAYSRGLDRWAVYAGETNVLSSTGGALGDGVEASTILILRRASATNGTYYVDFEIPAQPFNASFAAATAFQSLTPMWADVDGDGVDDLVTTVSDPTNGAGVQVHLIARNASSSDRTLAVKATVNGPRRGAGVWEHVLAWAPFGPGGVGELATVVNPHDSAAGGIATFYRFTSAQEDLAVVARSGAGQYTSHMRGSRNPGLALAIDVTGDGEAELVLALADRRGLAALQRRNSSAGVAELWRRTLQQPAEGLLQTNIIAACDGSGRTIIASGTSVSLMQSIVASVPADPPITIAATTTTTTTTAAPTTTPTTTTPAPTTAGPMAGGPMPTLTPSAAAASSWSTWSVATTLVLLVLAFAGAVQI